MYNKLLLDGDKEIKYHGSLVYAKNIVTDESGVSKTTENGFTELFDSNCNIIGFKVTNDDIIVCGVSGSFSIIGVYNFESETYDIKIRSEHLNFNTNNPIQIISFYNYLGELTIHIADGVTDSSNEVRIFNLDNLGVELDANKELINSDDVSNFNLKPNLNIGTITFNGLNSNGLLKTGSYIIYYGYILNDKRETSYLNSTQSIPVKTDLVENVTNTIDYTKITGEDSGIVTNHAISITINDIPTNVFSLKVGVLYDASGVKTAYKKEFTISNVNQIVEIDDLSTFENESITNIIEKPVNFTKANSLTVFTNRALYGNVLIPNISYLQRYINNIKVKWFVPNTKISYAKRGAYPDYEQTNFPYTYKNEVYLYNNKTFIPNEVVALYIELIHKNGTSLGHYHIPGREDVDDENYKFVNTSGLPKTIDITNPSYSQYADDYSISDEVYKFQTRDTSTKDSGVNEGNMGFWENKDEFYPDNDNWLVYNTSGPTGNTLVNKNVRHHRFPSQKTLIDNNITSNYIEDFSNLGLKLYDIDFPAEIKSMLQGYKIHYAVRNGVNNLVQDETILHNVNNYAALLNDNYDRVAEQNEMTFGLYNGTRVEYKYAIYPYNILVNEDPIAASYIKVNYALEVVRGLRIRYTTFTDDSVFDELYGYGIGIGKGLPFMNYSFTNSYTTPANQTVKTITSNNEIKHITSYDKLERGTIVNNVYNVYGDRGYIIELDDSLSDLTQFAATPVSTQTNGNASTYSANTYYNVSLMMFRVNVYNNFYQQTLAELTDIINIDDNIIYSTNGDSYVGLNAYKITTGYFESSGTIAKKGSSLISHPMYSQSNIELKYTYDFIFYPNLADATVPAMDFIQNYTYTKYDTTVLNTSFSKLNSNNVINIFNGINEELLKQKDLILVSNINSNESLFNNWASIEPTSYIITDITKGEIISLNASNNVLYIQKRDSLFVIIISSDLVTTDVNNITLQTVSMFNANIQEVVETDTEGYIGTKEKFSNVITPYGYVVFDTDKAKVFIVNGNKAKELSIGINEYLQQYLPYYKESVSNPFLSSGVTLGYNDINKMVLISYHSVGYQPETDVVLPEGLIAKRFTLSYSFRDEGWNSFHSYIPQIFDHNREGIFSCKGGFIYKHNNPNTSCKFYRYDRIAQKTYDDIYDYTFNSLMSDKGQYVGGDTLKHFESFEINANVYDFEGNPITDRQFDKIMCYNRTQCTGEIDISLQTGWYEDDGYRIILGKGFFNLLIDKVLNKNLLFIDKEQFEIINSNITDKNFFDLSKFISKFAVLRMIHTNSNKVKTEKIIVNNVKSNFKLR
jgi:hypothetical protein